MFVSTIILKTIISYGIYSLGAVRGSIGIGLIGQFVFMQQASGKAGNRNPEDEREWEQKTEPETEEEQ